MVIAPGAELTSRTSLRTYMLSLCASSCLGLPRLPTCHGKNDSIEAHLFIAVVAYHGAHLVRSKLESHGIHGSRESIRDDELHNIFLITLQMVENEYRYLITKADLGLPPEV